MNPKKAKRSKEKEESLLIAYHSNEDRGDSDTDNNVPPLDLPPTRLRRPRSRYYAVLLLVPKLHLINFKENGIC